MTSVNAAIVLAVALAGAALAAPGARGGSGQGLLEEGVRAYDEMELDAAAETLTKALRTSSSREKPRVELWLGIVELERGNEAAARRLFRSALRASPRLTVKKELSPKILATIDQVRAQVTPVRRARRTAPRPEPPAAPAAPPAAAPPSAAESAPAVVAAAAAPPVAPPVVPPVAPALAAAPVAPESDVAAAAGAPGDVEVAQASDEAAVREEPAPLVPVADGVAQGAPPASPLFFAGVAAGAVSIGAIGAGAVFGTLARMGGEEAQRESSAAAATQRYQEASVSALVANGLFVAGGVAAAVGATCGALALTESEEP